MLHLKGLLAVGNRLVLVSGLLVLCLLCRCIMWHLHPWNEKNCSFIALLNHSKTADENLSNLDLLLFFFLLLRHFKSWLEFTEKNKICLIVRVQILAPCSVFPTGQASICGGVVGGRGVAAAAAMTKKNAELEYNYNTLCTYLYTD